MFNSKVICTAAAVTVLLGLSSQASAKQTRAQFVAMANSACEAALLSGDLAALEKVRKQFRSVVTACSARASTATTTTSRSDPFEGSDGQRYGVETASRSAGNAASGGSIGSSTSGGGSIGSGTNVASTPSGEGGSSTTPPRPEPVNDSGGRTRNGGGLGFGNSNCNGNSCGGDNNSVAAEVRAENPSADRPSPTQHTPNTPNTPNDNSAKPEKPDDRDKPDTPGNNGGKKNEHDGV